MENAAIRIIFFDIGGVLLSNGWGHESRLEAAKQFGLNYAEMEVLHNFIFDVYELGKITLDEYLDTVVFNHPRDFTREDFKTFMFSQSVELPDMLPWLKEWKNNNPGIRVISINNEGKELNDYRIKKFGLHDCFDAFISSCHVGMRKPDPGIFHLAMGIAQVQPQECIYFDDRLMLAAASQKAGIRSFHHEHFETTKKNIEDIINEKLHNMKEENQNVFGIYGLGTMGRNLLLNMADHGFAVAGYNRKNEKVDLLMKEKKNDNVQGFTELTDFTGSLKSPKTIMLLVTAGKAVDDVIAEILPLLDKGDIIIDGGNSHFTDTVRRGKDLEEKGFHFFGMGVSGGEEGARKGPSIMPGGDEQAYLEVKPVLEKIAAQVNGEPCVTWLGPGAAGHFVKMVHNGIEYALMQLIAETYEILKKGLHLNNEAIHAVFKQWNDGRLQSFLLEVTRDIFAFKNPGADHLLLDDIKDEAKSKGTGKWTSQVAMDLQLPIPAIDTAVSMRDLSKYKSLRTEIAAMYNEKNADASLTANTNEYLVKLEQAFYFCMVTTYAQGMHLLFKASQTFEYKLKLDQVAKIWRGGCIIRASFLEDIYNAYKQNANLENLLTDKTIQSHLKESLPAIREVVSGAIINGLAIPAYAASLSYFDTIRSEQMPSNLIQAQRDYFGAHTYELIGKEGVFHTDWMSK